MYKWIEKSDPIYPENLRQISWPPERLYYEGDLSLISQPNMIAVVGTRRMTAYGQSVTERFTRELVARGYIIISGLARGVDRVAHETCLREGGRTIAVLAHGLGMTYPPEHRALRREIAAHGGLVVSEHADFVPLTKQNLAVRNRIVVALASAVLVTESPKSSGTKITVGFAADQGKDVYVVPGPVDDPTYAGSVELMREGCIPVGSVEDILV